MTDRWHKIGSLAALDEDEPIAAKINGREIGVFMAEGKVYAVDDVCPHAYALLTGGFVEGENIECPKHQAVFHLATGKCIAGAGKPGAGKAEPNLPDLVTHEVRLDGGAIYVALSTPD